MAEKKYTTWEVLRAKFPANEYVLIEEVSDASGYKRSRSLDYMLINLWESRGLAITGIEKKTNRSDWLRELKLPQKQENHFKYCDYFYLLTDRDDVAKLEEIPATWGWYHINARGILKTMKAAPKQNPIPVNRSLMCAMMRRAADKSSFVHVDTLEDAVQLRAEKIRENRNYEMERKVKEYDELKKRVDGFEAASGIELNSRYFDESKKIGEAVRIIMDGGLEGYRGSLDRLSKQFKNIYDEMMRGLDLLNSEQNVQASVATDDHQGVETG